jgi:hypothetical protein
MLILLLQTLNLNLTCSAPKATPGLSPSPGTIFNLNVHDVRPLVQVPAQSASVAHASTLNHDADDSVTESETDEEDLMPPKLKPKAKSTTVGALGVGKFMKSPKRVRLQVIYYLL